VTGSTLTCSQGSWAADIAPSFLFQAPQSYAYKWSAGGTAITGATGSTVTASSTGSYTCTVTATNHAGSTAQTSAGFTVTDPTPVNTAPPTIGGAPVAGQTLTEGHGTWTNAPTRYSYQWLRCNATGASCSPISGATAQTYVVAGSDIGSTLEVQEAAANATVSGVPATSAHTGLVSPALAGTVGHVAIAGATATLPITCAGLPGRSCTGAITATAHITKLRGRIVAVAARGKRNTTTSVVTVARATYSVAVGATNSVAVTLNSAGKQALGARYTLPVTLTVTGATAPSAIAFRYARITSLITYAALFHSSCCAPVTIYNLSVTGVPKGGRVVLRCLGGGCSPSRRTFVPHGGRLSVGSVVNTLAPPARLAIEVIAPNSVGKVDIVDSRPAGAPLDVFRCLPPGARSPVACA
jgi:hypothetical protein